MTLETDFPVAIEQDLGTGAYQKGLISSLMKLTTG